MKVDKVLKCIRLQVLIGLAALMMSLSVHAATPALKADHPEVYVVKAGDTLWGIAGHFLQQPWLWPEIWHINSQVNNPHLIYPGDQLYLTYVNGQPRLGFKPDSGMKRLANGVIKLSPKARVSAVDSVIPAIPLEAVKSFLVDNRVLQGGELDDAPYVIAGADEHIVMGKGDRFYTRGSYQENIRAYGLYRQGDAYTDPDTQEVLGYHAEDLGLAKLIKVDDDIATLKLLSANKDVRIGDHMLPMIERKLNSVFYPRAPKGDVNGQIIHVFGETLRYISQWSVVVINRGDRESMAVGDVLAIYRQGEQVRDRVTSQLIKLPSERAGLMILFRIFDKVSFGLVLEAERALQVLDEVKNP